jgi:hypothetical protein
MNMFNLKICFWVLLLPSLSFVAQTKPFVPIQVESKKWVKDDNNQPWAFYKTRIVDNLTDYKQTTDVENSYGSMLTEKTQASGFFRIEKSGNRWWVIDPEGHYNIQRVINGYRKGTSEQNEKSFMAQFGSDENWVNASAKFFSDIRINGTGSWSTDSITKLFNSKSASQKLSYSVNLRMMAAYGKKRGGTYQLPGNIGFPNQTIFVFDPEFAVFCDSLAKAEITANINDANLFGYFSDNELPFGIKNLEGYLTLINKKDPGFIAATNWLKSKGISEAKITDKERAEFAGYVVEKYYKTVSEAIRKVDPNHLYLGSRLHGNAKFVPEILTAAGKYCDVVSLNYYGVWTPTSEHLALWDKYLNKPFIITEFYTKAMDSGLANTTGAGYTVHTQKDRGYAYQDFCLALLESKNCVGWHYFKYQDNDPTAKGVDPSNVDSNKGIVDNYYKPYQDLINSMKQLNEQVYSLIKYLDK